MNTIKLNTIGTPVKKVAGGGASGGGGNYVYYSVDSSFEGVMLFANIIKVYNDGVLSFATSGFVAATNVSIDTVLAIGFDKSLKLTNFQTGELVTVEEFLIPMLDQQCTRISEEEFYRDPNALEDGYFRVLSDYENTDVILQYDDGMTWRDWINSHYNLNPTTNKPYISTNNEEHVNWNYSDGWSGSMHNEYESDSSIEIDDLITNKTYYAFIIA